MANPMSKQPDIARLDRVVAEARQRAAANHVTATHNPFTELKAMLKRSE